MNGTSKNNYIEVLFASLMCIIIVIIMTYSLSKETIREWISIWNKTRTNKTWEQKTWSERRTTITWSTMKQWTTKNTQKNDNTEKKPTRANPISWTVVYVKGFPEDSQATKIATYAYKISNWDIDFLATLKAENWWFNMYQQSNVYKNGKREESYGLCQMMKKYHPEVNTKIFRESREYQVETCYKKYKWGTKFYWFNVRHKYKDDFIIK